MPQIRVKFPSNGQLCLLITAYQNQISGGRGIILAHNFTIPDGRKMYIVSELVQQYMVIEVNCDVYGLE